MNKHLPITGATAPATRQPALTDSPVVGAGNPSKMPCLECEGKGEAEYMGLCEDRYHWRNCHVCDGSGLVKAYCETCQNDLTVDGFCCDCQEYGEGFEPDGWAKAEQSALGMPQPGGPNVI